ncbi:MAG: hypothetical protein HZT41_17875 [Dechloromonas sp.]|nr:MAG: hypothetical protein HZT41_17875 [Dechloromonas sp.]
MRLIDSAKSMVAVIRARAAMVRANRLLARGNLMGALAQAQGGLGILRKPYVLRRNPPEASAIVFLTILAEDISSPVGVTGATAIDLADSIAFLKQVAGDPLPEVCSYIPFLEARLAASSTQTIVGANLAVDRQGPG